MTVERGFRRILVVLSVLLTLFSGQAAALSGSEYRTLSDSSKFFYVAGVLDGWGNVIGVMDGAKEKSRTVDHMFGTIIRCAAGRMPHGQVRAIVDKFVADNPAKWHLQMEGLVWEAMWEACKP